MYYTPGELGRLLDAGLSVTEVGRLYRLRKLVLAGRGSHDGNRKAIRRLEFVRWLVKTGRINELDNA